MSARVAQQVRATIDRHGLLQRGDGLVLGVSGGPDSLCLLHLLLRLAPEYGVALQVGHLHHGIRGVDADADADYVERLCREWGVPCRVERVDVPAWAQIHGLAIEEAARQARYRFLASLALECGARTIAVGHNADDQVETVLMHLLRGSGLAGLRGMQPVARLDALRLGDDLEQRATRAGLRLTRPLLEVTRTDVEGYCREQGMAPRFDLSNLDQTYYRNRLRHELIPLLETYNPQVRQVLRRTADLLAADYVVLRTVLKGTWSDVVRSATPEAVVYDLARLRAQPVGLQRSLLREGVQRLRHALRNISLVHIDDALRVVRDGDAGAAATLPAGLQLRLGYAEAVLAAEGYQRIPDDGPRVGAESLVVPLPGSAMLPDGRWRIGTRIDARADLAGDPAANRDVLVAYLDADALTAPLVLRGRQAGDWLRPLGLGGRQKLHALMVNLKIPRAERGSVPLLVCGDAIAWVVGHRLDERFAVTSETQRVVTVRFECIGE